MTLEQVCANYYQFVYKRCFFLVKHPDIAEELTQEAFVRIVRNWPLDTTDHLTAWLWRVATTTVYDYWRKPRLDTFDMEDAASSLFDPHGDPSDAYSANETFLSAWNVLTLEYQTVLRLLAEGYKAGDIAEMQNTSPEEIYLTIRNARIMFKRKYNKIHYVEVAA